MMKYLSSQAGLDFLARDSLLDGSNCLQLAVQKRRLAMISHILENTEEERLKAVLNQQSAKTQESAIFFALKLENSEDKVKITKNLLSKSDLIDFQLQNATGHTCLEAHSDYTSYDQSAELVERAMLRSGSSSSSAQSMVHLQPLEPSTLKTESNAESQIFSQLNFSKASEVRFLMSQRDRLVDQLRNLQRSHLGVTDFYRHVSPQDLNQKLK